MHSTPISFHLSRITYVFLGIIAGVFIGTTIKFAFATWTPPQAGTIPPANNVTAPLNVSGIGQTKIGGLNLGSLMVQGSADVKGKIYSTSTKDSDPNNTVVTKDYLEGKLGGGTSGNIWAEYPKNHAEISVTRTRTGVSGSVVCKAKTDANGEPSIRLISSTCGASCATADTSWVVGVEAVTNGGHICTVSPRGLTYPGFYASILSVAAGFVSW